MTIKGKQNVITKCEVCLTEIRNGVWLQCFLSFLGEVSWPRITEKNKLGQGVLAGKCQHLFPSLVLQLLLKIRTALPQVMSRRVYLQNTGPKINSALSTEEWDSVSPLPPPITSLGVVHGKRARKALGKSSTSLHERSPGRHCLLGLSLEQSTGPVWLRILWRSSLEITM